MKRFSIFLITAILIAGTVSAQAIQDQRKEDNSVKVEGTLKLEKGFIALEKDGAVYYVPRLNRYIGFITGLREGARASVEGYEFKKGMIQPTKVTIDGKSYDFTARDRGTVPGFGNRDFQYPDKNRRAPAPRWDNQRNGNRSGRGGSCCR
jgi:hypothetical protein